MAQLAPILALISGALAILGVLGAYSGVLAPLSGFYAFGFGALAGGTLTVIVSLVSLFVSRGGRNPDGMRLAIAGLAVGVGLVLVVVASIAPSADLPPINDISTDLENPPQFASPSVVPEYVGRNMSYPPEFADSVREAYPDLRSLHDPAPPNQAYTKALRLATDLGWEIAAQSDTQFTFDARDETTLFRFVDDVTIRVEPAGTGSKVDIRSRSRDGQGDLGANAARIRSFIEAWE